MADEKERVNSASSSLLHPNEKKQILRFNSPCIKKQSQKTSEFKIAKEPSYNAYPYPYDFYSRQVIDHRLQKVSNHDSRRENSKIELDYQKEQD